MDRKPQEAAGEILEEADYVNTSVSTVDKTASTSDQKSPSFTQSILPIAVCWAVLILIMSLRIYFTSVIVENNGQLMLHNTELETQNQQLKEEKKNLTARIRELKTQGNQRNIIQAQLSVNLYCPITRGERKCKPCLDTWTPKPPNCYAVNDGELVNLRTWDSAQERCKEISSNLAVIANEQEKTSVDETLLDSAQNKEFWIGLRAENGKWKWLDGSELTNNSWIQQPAADGQCAGFLKNSVWSSVNCTERKPWICQQKALTLT